jgi:zinc and cadmium transporter
VITLGLRTKTLNKILLFLVAFAAGALIGDTFIHLLPEAGEENGFGLGFSLATVAGVLVFFILEKVLRWRHCHDLECNEHSSKHLGFINLIGDGFHNLIDGLLIGASFVVSVPLGVTTAIAVALHEIPQELGDFGVLLHSGFSKKKALFFNFLSASLAFAGVVIALILGGQIEGFTEFMIPFTIGSFLYIALADLMPELHRDNNFKRTAFHLFGLFAGIGVMMILLFFE